MPRYEEMDDLLRHVRDRLVDAAPAPEPATEPRPLVDTLQPDGPYEDALACIQSLLHGAELLRDLLGSEQAHTLGAVEHEHILSALNTVLQELWSSEVTLRRARLHD